MRVSSSAERPLKGRRRFMQAWRVPPKKAFEDHGLTRGRIGVDGADARILVQQSAPAVTIRAADDLMLHIRLVKTPAELLLMRRASAANVQAALATARAARQEGSVWRVRQRF